MGLYHIFVYKLPYAILLKLTKTLVSSNGHHTFLPSNKMNVKQKLKVTWEPHPRSQDVYIYTYIVSQYIKCNNCDRKISYIIHHCCRSYRLCSSNTNNSIGYIRMPLSSHRKKSLSVIDPFIKLR